MRPILPPRSASVSRAQLCSNTSLPGDQRLEAQGVIQNRVALLEPHKLNLNVTVFVSVKTSRRRTPAEDSVPPDSVRAQALEALHGPPEARDNQHGGEETPSMR